MIVIDENGLRSHRFAEPAPQGLRVRVRLPRPPRHHDHRPQRPRGRGSRWAAGWPASSRSTPTWSSRCPESGTPAAVGYAEESGIPYGQGLVKNAYVGRTFIQPSQTIRQLGIRLKLNPLDAT